VSADLYWERHAATLARIRAESPSTFAGVRLILDVFTPRSSGDAFFPDGGDDTLADALTDAGWTVTYLEGTYLYRASHPSGAVLTYVEGDLFEGVMA
jgi:hypothetical protein